MGASIAFVVIHLFRAAASALAMLAVGVVAWFAAGFVSALVGGQTVWFITIAAIVVAIIGICGGTFVSVRFITPGAVLHPVLGTLLLSAVYLKLFTSGDIGFVLFAVPLVAAAVAAASALALRSRSTAA